MYIFNKLSAELAPSGRISQALARPSRLCAFYYRALSYPWALRQEKRALALRVFVGRALVLRAGLTALLVIKTLLYILPTLT